MKILLRETINACDFEFYLYMLLLQINECRLMAEQDKLSLSDRLTTERDNLIKEYEGQLSLAESRLRDALEQQEKIAEERRAQHQEVK